LKKPTRGNPASNAPGIRKGVASLRSGLISRALLVWKLASETAGTGTKSSNDYSQNDEGQGEDKRSASRIGFGPTWGGLKKKKERDRIWNKPPSVDPGLIRGISRWGGAWGR